MSFLIILGVIIFCIFVIILLSNSESNKLDSFKNSNPELYQKYKDAFDSHPGHFTGVQLTVEMVEQILLSGETVNHSYSLPNFYDKTANLFVLTDKRLIYAGLKLTKREVKSIPYNKVENIDVLSKSLGTDLVVKSKEEKIEIFFNNFHKQYFDKFYAFLTEKQLSQSS